jgi:hypothetical protein
VTRITKRLLLLAVVAAAAALGVAAPSGAAAPCWKKLINDWYDGRIDGTYPIPCYQQAINHLPSDVESYSSAADDIRRALQERIKGKKSGYVTPTPTATGSSGPGRFNGTDGGGGGGSGKGGDGKGGDGKGGGTGASTAGPKGPPPTTGRKTAKGPLGEVLNAGSPHHADSVPIPLLVLAGIAVLLLAAGSAGLIARRLQARRVPSRRPTP